MHHQFTLADCEANAQVWRRAEAWHRKCAATARTAGHRVYHHGEELAAGRKAHMWDERASRLRHAEAVAA